MTIYDGRWQLILVNKVATVELASVTALVEKVTKVFPWERVCPALPDGHYFQNMGNKQNQKSVFLSLSDLIH